MKIMIAINCDNDAFVAPARGTISGVEVARILRGIASRAEGIYLNERDTYGLTDINGNLVGRFEVSK